MADSNILLSPTVICSGNISRTFKDVVLDFGAGSFNDCLKCHHFPSLAHYHDGTVVKKLKIQEDFGGLEKQNIFIHASELEIAH